MDELSSPPIEVDLQEDAALRAKKTARNKRKEENARANKLRNAGKAIMDGATALKDLVAVKESQDAEQSATASLISSTLAQGNRGVGVEEDFLKLLSNMMAGEFGIDCLHESGLCGHTVDGDGDICTGFEGDIDGGRSFVVRDSPGKGLGVFALRAFEKGEEIFREAPLIPAIGNGSWIKKEAEFLVASEERKAKFEALVGRCTCRQTPCNETAFMKIYAVNNFELTSLHKKGYAPRRIYEVASRLNHACRSNAMYTFTNEEHMVIRARKVISKGDVMESMGEDETKMGDSAISAVIVEYERYLRTFNQFGLNDDVLDKHHRRLVKTFEDMVNENTRAISPFNFMASSIWSIQTSLMMCAANY